MLKKYKNLIKISQYVFCSIILLMTVNTALAITTDSLSSSQFGLQGLASEVGYSGSGEGETPLAIAGVLGQMIGWIMSLIGILFMVLITMAGFTWMTAKGNEEEVEKAKTTLFNSALGIVIVFGAYAISYYIINALSTAIIE